jgi:hypothetical protein
MEKMTTHAVKGPFKKKTFSSEDPQAVTWLPGNMNGNTYAVSFKGEVFTYEVSQGSVAKLRAVKNRIYSAFDAATTSKPDA